MTWALLLHQHPPYMCCMPYTQGHTEQQRVRETCEALRKELAVPRVFTLAFTKSLVQPLSSILGFHVT